MAKKPKTEEVEPELEGEVEPLDVTNNDKVVVATAEPLPEIPSEGAVMGAVAYFEEPAEFKHSFELGFILDVLLSEYSVKEKSIITRPSGATLLENTYRPIFSSEGIGGIRRETVFSYKGGYFKIAASCSPDQDQRFINWDWPAVKNGSQVVMAQKVDPVQKTVTVYLPSTE